MVEKGVVVKGKNRGQNTGKDQKLPHPTSSDPWDDPTPWATYIHETQGHKKRDVGKEAELLITELGIHLARTRHIFFGGRRIVHAFRCQGDKVLQNIDYGCGVDVLIWFDSGGLALPIQVKHGTRGKNSHLRDYPYTLVVITLGGDLPRSVKDMTTYHSILNILIDHINDSLKKHAHSA